ncbi:hypothetical protein BH09PSE2_BH09PSE2_21550 [soil metagenome]
MLATILMVSGTFGAVRADELTRFHAMVTTEARSAFARYAAAPCADATVTLGSPRPVTLQGRPDLKAMVQPTRVTGCGRASLQSVNVVRSGGDPPWRMASPLPGSSLADPALQQRTLLSVAAHARRTLPGACATPAIGDIRVVAPPGALWFRGRDVETPRPRVRGAVAVPLPPAVAARRRSLLLSRAWMELWPLGWCGAAHEDAVVFIPRRDAGAPFYMLADVPTAKSPASVAVSRSSLRSAPPAP